MPERSNIMNMNFRTLAAFCALSFAVTGCSDNGSSKTSNSVSPLMSGDNASTVEYDIDDLSASESAAPLSSDCEVKFSDSGISVDGTGVTVSGNVITVTSAGVFSLSGSCSDGKVIVEAGDEDEVTLLLNGLTLSCSDNSAIECRSACKLTISAADGTDNTISDSSEYFFDDNTDEPDAAVYSRCDLIINGSGTLNVNGNYKDGIKGKDGLKICGVTVNVTSSDDGIKGRDYIIIGSGNINVNAGGDGLKTTNTDDETLGYINIAGGAVYLTAKKDAIQAETEFSMDDGCLTLYTGNGSASVQHSGTADRRDPFDMDASDNSDSMKGIKAGTLIRINGGEITADVEDDSIHSNGSIIIGGGELRLSTGDDGIHADENLTINGGVITIPTSYEGLEAKSIDINGGTIDIVSFDDGLNAGGGDNGEFFGFNGDGSEYYISVSDGSLTINSQGDGIDSNGSVAMSGGMVVVFGPSNDGNGALDYGDSFALSGGTLIALGSKGMAQAPSTLSQPCLSIYSNVSAGASIEVRNADDQVVLNIETPKACQSLIFSSSEFKSGETYTIYADGNVLASVTATDGVSGDGVNGSGSGFGGGFGGGGFGRDFGNRTTPPDDGGNGMGKPGRDFNNVSAA